MALQAFRRIPRTCRLGMGLLAALTLLAPSRAGAACATTAWASPGGAGIQSAVDAAPRSLVAGDHCVTVDGGAYREEVVVRGIQTNGFRLVIAAVQGSTVTVVPPAGAQAGVIVDAPGVTLSGLTVQPDHPLPYGILVTGASALLTRVGVSDPSGKVATAGIAFSAPGSLSGSRVKVQAAHAVLLEGVSGAALGDSVLESSGPDHLALRLTGASRNALSNLTVTNWGGTAGAFLSGSDSNTIDLCAFKSGHGGLGLVLERSSSNSIRRSRMTGGAADDWFDGGHGLSIREGTSNSLDQSTMTGGLGGWGAGGGYGAYVESDGTSISASALTGATGGRRPPGYLSPGGHGLYVKASRLSVASSQLAGGLGGRCAGGGGGPGGHALFADGGGNHTVLSSVLTGGIGGTAGAGHDAGAGGHGLRLSTSSFNNVTLSSLVGGPAGYGPRSAPGGRGLSVEAGESNVFDQDSMTGGKGAGTWEDVAAGRGGAGARLEGSRSNAVRRSSLTGGDGGHGDGDDGGPGGPGLSLRSSRSDTVSASTISAGNGGDGHSWGPAGAGVELSSVSGLSMDSCAIKAARHGLEIDAGDPETGFSLSELGFAQLRSTEAVAIHFSGGKLTAELRGMTFADGTVVTNVDASLLDPGSRVDMAQAKGPRAGPYFEVDPSSVVAWSGFPTGPPTAAPGTPVGTALGISSISWTWEAAEGATSYRVAAPDGALLKNLEGPPFVQTALSSDTAYGIAVAAVNYYGAGPLSAAGYARTKPAPLPGKPGVPAGLTLGVSSISWSWDRASDADYYRVFLATSPTTRIATVTDPSFVQRYLSSNTAYGIVVAGVNVYGVGPLSGPGSASTEGAWPPGQPGTPVGTALGMSSISWTWASAPQATSYRVFLATSPTTRIATVTDPSFVQRYLSSNTAYGIVVAGVNGNGAGPLSSPGYATTGGPGSASIGSGGGSVVLGAPSGQVWVQIPPGAFDRTVNVSLRLPASYPRGRSATLAGLGIGVEVLVTPAVQPGADASLVVSYRDQDVARAEAGRLVLARYDEAQDGWVPLPSTPDPARGRVSALTRHFSLFQLMEASPSSGSVDAIRAFPNPLRPALGQAAMTIAGLPAFSRVRVYTLSGELVKDLSAGAAGTASWDGTNGSGQRAASGVYFILAQGNGSKKTFKVAIQR